MHWVFLGPNGLRAGWAILLFAVILVATDFLAFWALQSTMHRMAQAAGMVRGQNSAMPVGLGFLQEILQASGMFVATFVMSRIERRPALAYGFQGKSRVLRFFSGLLLGFAAISAFVLVLWKAGFLSLDGQLLHGAALWKYAVGWGAVFILVAIFEESLFRGYLQYTLTRGLGFWWGAMLVSFLFGFGHGSNPGETPVGLFSAAAIGLVLCLSLWYTGSLWWAVGFHAAWDWGESYFYGTSDSGMIAKGHLFGEHPVGQLLWSGGATGPEGSILVLPLIAIFALLMWLWWGRRGEKPFKGAAWRPRAF
jgi:membrane protease YdiL (CAAX protease family)